MKLWGCIIHSHHISYYISYTKYYMQTTISNVNTQIMTLLLYPISLTSICPKMLTNLCAINVTKDLIDKLIFSLSCISACHDLIHYFLNPLLRRRSTISQFNPFFIFIKVFKPKSSGVT